MKLSVAKQMIVDLLNATEPGSSKAQVLAHIQHTIHWCPDAKEARYHLFQAFYRPDLTGAEQWAYEAVMRILREAHDDEEAA